MPAGGVALESRFAEQGVGALLRDKTRPPGPPPLPADTVARVVAMTCAEPADEATHWTGRAMAKQVGISLSSVERIWAEPGWASSSSTTTSRTCTESAIALSSWRLVGSSVPCTETT